MRRPRLPLIVVALLLAAEAPAASLRGGGNGWCRTSRAGARDAVFAHRERRGQAAPEGRYRRSAQADTGAIAVIVDEGDLALARNPMDLQRAAVRFSPTADGYSVSRLDLPLEAEAGTALDLSDDDSERVSLGFAFPFYGTSYSEGFLNSDGNLTFGEKDDASTERNVGRLVNGPPRIAPLLADLNPEIGGTVSVLVLRDHVTMTWSAVPQFGRVDRNTFQAVLWADGRIDFVYDLALSANIEEGAVGVSPGGARGGLTAVDFATAAAVTGGAGSLVESFRAQDSFDAVAVARKFYAQNPDDYQQLIVFTSRTLVPTDAFAYELAVKNTDTGIGLADDDLSRDFGSGGRLESFVMMDVVTKYPEDPSLRFLGEDSALSVLAHEVGHRWLAKALFRDGGTMSSELLGRDQVHWSFFADTDGSFLEGNDIEVQGDAFRTVGASRRYSAFDQYLMGMRDASEVPSFFFVRNPVGTSANPGRKPQTGVAFSGTRKDVGIKDVVAAIGARNPPGAPWAQPFRQAFIYVAVGGAADPSALEKVERIRAAWPAFFAQATEGRGSVEASLN